MNAKTFSVINLFALLSLSVVSTYLPIESEGLRFFLDLLQALLGLSLI